MLIILVSSSALRVDSVRPSIRNVFLSSTIVILIEGMAEWTRERPTSLIRERAETRLTQQSDPSKLYILTKREIIVCWLSEKKSLIVADEEQW